MKKTIKFQDGSMQEFNLNREGFIQAVSYKESSADLKLSSNHKINMMAAKKVVQAVIQVSFKWESLPYLKQVTI